MFRSAVRFLLQPLQFARQTGLRRRAHPIDKEDSVEMIDLVLNGARQEPNRFDFDRIAIQILSPHCD